MTQKTLQVKVIEDVQTTETLHKWKRWFNGAKHFFTVHPQPPTPELKLVDGEWVRVNKPTSKP